MIKIIREKNVCHMIDTLIVSTVIIFREWEKKRKGCKGAHGKSRLAGSEAMSYQ